MKVKKLILLVGLMVLAQSAMATNPGSTQCSAWRTAANGNLVCASTNNGPVTNNTTTTTNCNPGQYGCDNNHNNNNNNNHNNHNQGCGGFGQQQCDWPGSGQPMSPWQYQQVKATGRDAVNIILNSDMLTSGMTNDGWSRYTVRYTGNQYTSLKGVVFNCKVAPNAREFECVNWLPPKPKQVQFGNGNWQIIFELYNQYKQNKNQ